MNRSTIILLTVIFISSPLAAFDWSKRNIKVENTEQKETETLLTLKAEDNTVFTVRYRDDIDEGAVDKIVKMNGDFRKWKDMEVGNLEFVVQKDLIQAVVIPAKYSFRGTNIIPYMPAGMLFEITDSMKYNFRINVDNNFVRIEDKFIGEDVLSDKIVKAVKDPILYLTTDNPKYLLRKITDSQAQIEELKRNYDRLLDMHEKLKAAVMGVHNTGFLGFGEKLVNKNLIKRIIELKTANPRITKDEISKKLEAEKMEFKGNEIVLILKVYYNEFQ